MEWCGFGSLRRRCRQQARARVRPAAGRAERAGPKCCSRAAERRRGPRGGARPADACGAGRTGGAGPAAGACLRRNGGAVRDLGWYGLSVDRSGARAVCRVPADRRAIGGPRGAGRRCADRIRIEPLYGGRPRYQACGAGMRCPSTAVECRRISRCRKRHRLMDPVPLPRVPIAAPRPLRCRALARHRIGRLPLPRRGWAAQPVWMTPLIHQGERASIPLTGCHPNGRAYCAGGSPRTYPRTTARTRAMSPWGRARTRCRARYRAAGAAPAVAAKSAVAWWTFGRAADAAHDGRVGKPGVFRGAAPGFPRGIPPPAPRARTGPNGPAHGPFGPARRPRQPPDRTGSGHPAAHRLRRPPPHRGQSTGGSWKGRPPGTARCAAQPTPPGSGPLRRGGCAPGAGVFGDGSGLARFQGVETHQRSGRVGGEAVGPVGPQANLLRGGRCQ